MINVRIGLILEIILLFILLPLLFLYDFLPGAWKLVPLILFLAYFVWILWKKQWLGREDFSLKRVRIVDWLKLFVFPIGLFAVLYFIWPDYLIADLSNKKLVFAIVCYPFFSVLPQEIIFRKFFFSRYGDLLPRLIALVLLNAVLFSFAHIYFQNWLALGLTFVGGIAFSITYLKSKSLLFVSIEHCLYGLAILCSGLSDFFYRAF